MVTARIPDPGKAAMAVALSLACALSFAGTRGPDPAGYTATDAAVFSFVDIAGPGGGASILAGTDDGTAALTLPFPFTFYGQARTLACVSTNGAMYFISDLAQCSGFNDFANTDLSSTAPPGDRPALLPFWTDLTFDAPGADAIAYQTLGLPGARRFVIQWNKAYPQGSANPVTFQIVLTEGTDKVVFQYKTVALGPGNPYSLGAQATIGIRDASGQTNGRQIQWSYNAPVLTDDSALMYIASTQPVVSTPTSASITASGATLGGTITSDGGSAITARGVVVAPTAANPDPTIGAGGVVTVTEGGTATGVFTTGVSGLAPATEYSYKAWAMNAAGTGYTSVAAFTTSAIAPTATTGAATSIGVTGATLNGTVNPNGSGTTAVFDYGTTVSYTSQVTVSPAPGAGQAPVSVSAAIGSLNCATTYHFRLAANNVAGTTNGDDAQFTTSACPLPTLSINDVTVAEGNSGTANATFTVTLSAASAQTVTVSAVTSNLSASAGSDYTATGPTTLTFAPGVTTQTLVVPVTGDTAIESDETFQVTLSSPTNATILDGVGIGTIVNDDGAPPARVFVSNSGSDAALCSGQTTPCRNLAAAISQVAIDGEVIVLTPGEYESSPLIIGKGLKITSPPGTVAFIRQPITVNAPGGRVVLRGLTIKGAGAGNGVTLAAADSLSIEDSTIDRWLTGLRLSNAAASRVSILNSVLRSNGLGVLDSGAAASNQVAVSESRFEGNGKGLEILAGAFQVRESAFVGNTTSGITAGPGSADIGRSEFSLNGTGVATLPGGTLRIGRSRVFGNGVGLDASAGGTLASYGSNVVRGNGTNTAGVIATIPEQ